MSLRKVLVAFSLAASMSSAPILAQGVPSSTPAVEARAGATTESESELRGGFIIPIIVIMAIILGVWAATSGGDSDPPHSP